MNVETQPTAGSRLTKEQAIAKIGDGVVTLEDKQYMHDSSKRLVPIELVPPPNKLEDQTVRAIIGFAVDLSEQIDRFRGHTFEDVGAFIDLLHEQYDTIRGGRKGNVTLNTLDGLYRVQVQVQDQLTFGPELQVAKSLVDAYITSWAADANAQIRALVQHAFQVDQQGRINRSALFALRRLDIDDDQWRKAMQALGDAIRVIGSKEYVRFYKRKHHGAPWEAITVDLAKAVS